MKILFLLPLLTACSLNSVATPKTISLEAGTSIRQEVGDPASKVKTVAVKAVWELRK